VFFFGTHLSLYYKTSHVPSLRQVSSLFASSFENEWPDTAEVCAVLRSMRKRWSRCLCAPAEAEARQVHEVLQGTVNFKMERVNFTAGWCSQRAHPDLWQRSDRVIPVTRRSDARACCTCSLYVPGLR
jgi:hypothetical protein